MSKYQEALNNIIIHRPYALEGTRLGKSIETIQELVEKETPMKPISIDSLNNFECKKCNNATLWKEETDYCCVCGQRIDWSDEK